MKEAWRREDLARLLRVEGFATSVLQTPTSPHHQTVITQTVITESR
jgi:hypothetical protein